MIPSPFSQASEQCGHQSFQLLRAGCTSFGQHSASFCALGMKKMVLLHTYFYFLHLLPSTEKVGSLEVSAVVLQKQDPSRKMATPTSHKIASTCWHLLSQCKSMTMSSAWWQEYNYQPFYPGKNESETVLFYLVSTLESRNESSKSLL